MAVGKILLEGEIFNCPKNTEEFLKINYNYLGYGAVFSTETGLYYKKET